MSKYLFYAAFLYFCWYAGNKAFPSNPQPSASAVQSEQAWVNISNKKSATATNAKVETSLPLSNRPVNNEEQEKIKLLFPADLPAGRQVFADRIQADARRSFCANPKSFLFAQICGVFNLRISAEFSICENLREAFLFVKT